MYKTKKLKATATLTKKDAKKRRTRKIDEEEEEEENGETIKKRLEKKYMKGRIRLRGLGTSMVREKRPGGHGTSKKKDEPEDDDDDNAPLSFCRFLFKNRVSSDRSFVLLDEDLLNPPEIPETDVDYVIKKSFYHGSSVLDKRWSAFASELILYLSSVKMAIAELDVTLCKNGRDALKCIKEGSKTGVECVCPDKMSCTKTHLLKIVPSETSRNCPLYAAKCCYYAMTLYGILKEYAFWLFQKKNATKICSLNGFLNQKTGYRVDEENAPLIKYVFDVVLQLRRVCRWQTIDSYFDESLFSAQCGDSAFWLPMLFERYPNLFSEALEKRISEKADDGDYEHFRSMDLLEVMSCIKDVYLGHNVVQTSLPLRWWIDNLSDRGSVLTFDFHSNEVLNAKHLTFVGKYKDKIEDVLESFAFEMEDVQLKKFLKFERKVPTLPLPEMIRADSSDSKRDVLRIELPEPKAIAIEKSVSFSSPSSSSSSVEEDGENGGRVPKSSYSDIVLPQFCSDAPVQIVENRLDEKVLSAEGAIDLEPFQKCEPEANGSNLTEDQSSSAVVRDAITKCLSLDVHDAWKNCLAFSKLKKKREREEQNDLFFADLVECISNEIKASEKRVGEREPKEEEEEEKWRDLKNDITNEKAGESTFCGDHLKFYFGLFEISGYERNVFFDHFPTKRFWDCPVFERTKKDSLKKLKMFYEEMDVYLRLLMRFKLIFCPELLRENVTKMFNESFCSKYDVSWYDYEGKNALEFVRRRLTTDAGNMLEQMYNSLSVKIKIKAKEGESELLDEFRTDLRYRGFADGLRLRLITSSIGSNIQKFMATDSAYVLHRAQWTNKSNLEWFNLRRWPILCYVDGSYRCVYEGYRWQYNEVGREIFDYIERLQDDRYVFECKKNLGNGTPKYELFVEMVKFWRTLKRFVTGKNRDGEISFDEEKIYEFTSDSEKCDRIVKNTKHFLCEDVFLDRHAYDLLFGDRFLDCVLEEWGVKRSISTSKEEKSSEVSTAFESLLLDADGLHRKLFGQEMPIMKAWDCMESLSEKSWEKNASFDYQGGAGCDTVYDAFIQWILLMLKGQDEIALSEDVRKSLLSSVRDLRRWCESESKYTNEDVIRERSEATKTSAALARKNMVKMNSKEEEGEEGKKPLKTKKREKTSLKETGKQGVYDEKREKFDTNSTKMSLKSNPIIDLLSAIKEYMPVLESLERNLHMVDKW